MTTASQRPRPKRSQTWLWLGGCLLLALALRLYGLRFGLPQLYYWDEPTVVNRAMRFGTGDLNPHYFYYPAFYMYVLFVASGVYFVLGRLGGVFHGAQEFAKTYFIDPSGVYLAARVTTALLGVLAVLAVYQLGKRYFNARVGSLAALVLAVSPLHVSHSHIAITDVPHALLICLASVACHDVLSRGRMRDYALAGVLIGLGTATKYLAILNLATLGLAHLLRHDECWRPRFDAPRLLRVAIAAPQVWVGLGASFIGFFVGSPYNVLKLGEFIADFRAQMGLSAGEAGQGLLLLRTTLADFGVLQCLLAAFGLVQLLRRPSRSTWVLLCFPTLYALLMLKISKSFARYLLPESAFIAVAAAYGTWAVVDWIERRASPLLARATLGIGVVAMVAWPLAVSVGWDVLQATKVDTRTSALRWAEHTLPTGSKVLVQSLYDRTFDNVPIVTDKTLERLERVLPTTGSFGRVRQEVLDSWQARPVYRDVGWTERQSELERTTARYVFVTEANGPPPPERLAWLARSGHLLRRFDPDVPWPLKTDQSWREHLPVMPPSLSIYELAQLGP